MQIKPLPSPNFDERTQPVSILLLHYTGMKTASDAINRLKNPAAKVSCHYVVDEDGAIIRMVDEAKRAWHAGKGFWRGSRDINCSSIGIEIVNPGHEFGYRAFPRVQIASVIALSKDILARHKIAAHNVLGHSDTAVERKEDPGELFPWEELAQNGIGLFPPASLSAPSKSPAQFEADLRKYGYGFYDETPHANALSALTRALHRHFYPEALDKPADSRSHAIIDWLLRQGA